MVVRVVDETIYIMKKRILYFFKTLLVGFAILGILYIIILPVYLLYKNVLIVTQWRYIVLFFVVASIIGTLSTLKKIPFVSFFTKIFLFSFSSFYKEFLLQSAKYFCSENNTNPFTEIVEIEFDNRIRILGFLTNKYKNYSVIYIPTAPNPTSGFVLNVPNDKVKSTKLTPEEMLEYTFTHGVKTFNDKM
jgi:uncharacterized membrane protein